MNKNLYRLILSIFILIGMASISYATTDDAITSYSFDVDDGATTADDSGNGNTGDVYGATYITDNLIILNTGAFSFDGTDDYIDSNTPTTGLTDFTISVWAKSDDITQTKKVVGNYDGTGAYVFIGHHGSFGWVFESRDSNSITVSGITSNSRDTDWHHLVLVRDSTNNFMRLYVDNVLVQDETDTRTGNLESNDWIIGSFTDSSDFFAGDEEQFIYYDRPLTTSEISELWNSGDGFNPYAGAVENKTITFLNITANNETLINDSFFNTTIINFTTILNVTADTNNLVNISYNYDDTGFVQFGNETLNASFVILNITSTISSNLSRNGDPILATTTNADRVCVEEGFVEHLTFNQSPPFSIEYASWNGTEWVSTNVTNGVGLIGVECIGGIPEGVHNISFFAENNETNTTSQNFTFTVDLTAPVIDVIDNISQNNLEINFSTIFNVTDALSGLDSCTINITELENVTSPDNFLINCTDTQTFTSAGKHNFFVLATDNAGNIETLSINDTIIPYIFVFFNSTATNITQTDYSIRIFHPDGRITSPTPNDDGATLLSPVNEGELDLGIHTLEFTKFGFNRENFTVNITESSNFNITFNVTPVTLNIKMFNISNTDEQLTFNVTILNDSESAVFENQTNFSKSFELIPTGDIEIRVTSPGFAEARYFQTLDPFTSVTIEGLLTSIDIFDIIQFTVLEFGNDKPLEGVVIDVRQLINGSFVTVSQGETDSSGRTYINLDPSQSYEFVFSKDGFVSAVVNSIPGTLTYTIRLKLETELFAFIDGVSYQLLPTNNILFIDEPVTFKAFISDTSITLTTYTITDDLGNTLFTDSSTNPTGTSFEFDFTPTEAQNISKIFVRLSYTKNSITNTISKDYDVVLFNETSSIGILKNFGDNSDEDSQITRWLIMVVAIAAGILAGRLVGANTTGAGLLMIPITAFFAFIGWMPVTYFGVLSAASMFFFVGGSLAR